MVMVVTAVSALNTAAAASAVSSVMEVLMAVLLKMKTMMISETFGSRRFPEAAPLIKQTDRETNFFAKTLEKSEKVNCNVVVQ